MKTWQNALAERIKTRKISLTMGILFEPFDKAPSATITKCIPDLIERMAEDPIAVSPVQLADETNQNPWVIRKIWLGALANPRRFVTALRHSASQWLDIAADQVVHDWVITLLLLTRFC